MKAPKVSVLMKTYNHAGFIRHAVESVLMQEVDFDYEIILGEDCSSDGTRSIVEELALQFPEKIRAILPERNIGRVAMIELTFSQCRGTYIALLEGDDYWTSPHKLRRQVEFLDRNPDCTECVHNVRVAYSDGSADQDYTRFTKSRYTIEDVLQSVVHLPTCSLVFRKGLFEKYPDWIHSLDMADLPLHVLNSMHGAIGVLDETMATYRVHEGGVWSVGLGSSRWSLKTFQKRNHSMVKFYETINAFLEFRYDEIIRLKLSMLHYDLVWSYQEDGNRLMMRTHLMKAYQARLFNSNTSRKYMVKAWILGFVPFVFPGYLFLKRRKQMDCLPC